MKHDLRPFGAIVASATSLEPAYRPDLTQVRAKITFVDGSVLHIRENYVLPENWIDYAYQWQTADHQLIIRWDNAHPVDLPTSPHHQHIDTEENIQPSEPMTLATVLTVIAAQL